MHVCFANLLISIDSNPPKGRSIPAADLSAAAGCHTRIPRGQPKAGLLAAEKSAGAQEEVVLAVAGEVHIHVACIAVGSGHALEADRNSGYFVRRTFGLEVAKLVDRHWGYMRRYSQVVGCAFEIGGIDLAYFDSEAVVVVEKRIPHFASCRRKDGRIEDVLTVAGHFVGY